MIHTYWKSVAVGVATLLVGSGIVVATLGYAGPLAPLALTAFAGAIVVGAWVLRRIERARNVVSHPPGGFEDGLQDTGEQPRVEVRVPRSSNEIGLSTQDWLTRGSPPPPSPNPLVRLVMMIALTVALVGSALYIILSKGYDTESEKWAFGIIGMFAGFWLG